MLAHKRTSRRSTTHLKCVHVTSFTQLTRDSRTNRANPLRGRCPSGSSKNHNHASALASSAASGADAGAPSSTSRTSMPAAPGAMLSTWSISISFFFLAIASAYARGDISCSCFEDTPPGSGATAKPFLRVAKEMARTQRRSRAETPPATAAFQQNVSIPHVSSSIQLSLSPLEISPLEAPKADPIRESNAARRAAECKCRAEPI